MKKKLLWITWEDHRRNQEICKKTSIYLVQLDDIAKIKNPIRKYLTGLFKSYKIFNAYKPDLIICQNPSIILTLYTLSQKIYSTRKVVVDSHNAGLYPMEGRSRMLMILSRFIQRHSNLTIVTNESLKDEVERNGGIGFVLPDPIPDIPRYPEICLKDGFNILFICSYAKDEPYNNVIEAARLLDNTFHIYVTGNYEKCEVDQKLLPANVTLLGFIPARQYAAMLCSVHATIDLTDRENCLVCGAYESVAAEKPMILSGSKALQSYFSKGAVYTDNSVADLVSAIKKLRQDYERLRIEMRDLKIDKKRQWATFGNDLNRTIETLIAE